MEEQVLSVLMVVHANPEEAPMYVNVQMDIAFQTAKTVSEQLVF